MTTFAQYDYKDQIINSAACPGYVPEIGMDLCQDYQMQGNAEFVPRVIEEELAERWIMRCEACDSMHNSSRRLEWPEMNLE